MGGAVSVTHVVYATIHETAYKVSTSSPSSFVAASWSDRRRDYECDGEFESELKEGDVSDISTRGNLKDGQGSSLLADSKADDQGSEWGEAKGRNWDNRGALGKIDISGESAFTLDSSSATIEVLRSSHSLHMIPSSSSLSNIGILARNFHSKLSNRSSYLDLSSNASSSSERDGGPFSKSIYNCTSFYDSKSRRSNYRTTYNAESSERILTDLQGSMIEEVFSDENFSQHNSEVFNTKPFVAPHNKITDDSDWIQVEDNDEEDYLDASTQASAAALGAGPIRKPEGVQPSQRTSYDSETAAETDSIGELKEAVDAQGSGQRKPHKLTIQINSETSNSNGASGDNHSASYNRSPLSRHHQHPTSNRNQSYIFTQSGTILMDGLIGGIKKCGLFIEDGIEMKSIDRLESISSKGSNSRSNSYGSEKVAAAAVPGGSVSLSSSPGLLTMKERLLVLTKLGQGASSVVFKSFDLATLRLVAIKMISIFDKGKRRQMVRELVALFGIIHGNFKMQGGDFSIEGNNKGGPVGSDASKYVVDFYDVFSNIDDGRVVLMMEYIDGGSLQDAIDDIGEMRKKQQSAYNGNYGTSSYVEPILLNESIISKIAFQCLKCISFLHSLNCLHRDVKPSNFLISRNGTVKIADMGVLKRLDLATPGTRGNDSSNNCLENTQTQGDVCQAKPSLPKTKTFVGTTVYMSPERLEGKEYSFDSDIWSLGLSLLSAALGKAPFEGAASYWAVLQSIREGVLPTKQTDAKETSSNCSSYYANFYLYSEICQDFIRQCLQEIPSARPSPTVLLQHEFIKRYNEDVLLTSSSAGKHSSECKNCDTGVFFNEASDFVLESLQEYRLILESTHKHLALLKSSATQEYAEWIHQSRTISPSSLSDSHARSGDAHVVSHNEFTEPAKNSNKPKLKIVIEPPSNHSNASDKDEPSTPYSGYDRNSNQLHDPRDGVSLPPPNFEKVVLGNVLNSSVKSMMCRVFFGIDRTPGASELTESSIYRSRLSRIAAQLYISDVSLIEKETISYIASLTDA
jgi:serine/threonine protein kinase